MPVNQPRNLSPVRLLPLIHSEDLFGAGDEVVVIHNQAHYRLRRTRNGKLILNK